MTEVTDQMHIGMWLSYIDGLGGWREPDSGIENFASADPYIQVAQLAERGKLDAVFRGDTVAADSLSATGGPVGGLEILTLLAAISSRTTSIGLIGTVSTTFSDPYNTARQLASLDHLSKGRFGWNIVTSFVGEKNFGSSVIADQDQRYARAHEYVAVVKALWNSWAPGAVTIDRESGQYADPDLIRPIDHIGEHFRVAGPLNVQRSPQGRPVFIQAGSSGVGKAFAAEHAEVIFTAAQTIDEAQAFYADMKTKIAENGRDPDRVKILPGMSVFIAKDSKTARARLHEKLDLIDHRAQIGGLEALLGGAQLAQLDLDDRIPASLLPDTTTLIRRQSRAQIFVDLALERDYTLREVIEAYVLTNGHGSVVGDPREVAEHLISWHAAKAADGFVIFPGTGIEGVELFVDEVVPILQRRGVFRTEYTGTTLRDHFELPELVE